MFHILRPFRRMWFWTKKILSRVRKRLERLWCLISFHMVKITGKKKFANNARKDWSRHRSVKNSIVKTSYHNRWSFRLNVYACRKMLSPNNFGTLLEIRTQNAAPSSLHADFALGEVRHHTYLILILPLDVMTGSWSNPSFTMMSVSGSNRHRVVLFFWEGGGCRMEQWLPLINLTWLYY